MKEMKVSEWMGEEEKRVEEMMEIFEGESKG